MGGLMPASQRQHVNANNRAKRMRRAPTPAEASLWKRLRKFAGFHFRRQLALGDYVFDFGDHTAKLLVEVDGGVHDAPDVAARDTAKAVWADSQGYRLVRIENAIALHEPELALTLIREARDRVDTPPPLTPPHKGEGDEIGEGAAP